MLSFHKLSVFTMMAFVMGLLALGFSSCFKDEKILEDAGIQLTFSTDTLRFDTVFTQLGSATRTLKLYNPYDKKVVISNISVKTNNQGRFRFNVDGLPLAQAKEIEILPKDSLYVFGEVTIDPDQPLSVSPYIIEDQLEFTINGGVQTVRLEAWGQNANYIPSRFAKGGFAYLSCNFGEITWDDPKPYVIYGFLVIDSCTLRLPPATRVYVHGGIAKIDDLNGPIIYNDGLIYTIGRGKLFVEGTLDQPVTIEGDRLESAFDDEPGQWTGIRLATTGNKIEYATIKNSLVGIYVDSAASVTLKNVQIYNTTGVGIQGFHGNIQATNCLVYNNGSRCVQLSYGGNYKFDYCTFASYGVDAPALSFANGYCADALCTTGIFLNDLSARFNNCIIFGSRADEIDISDFDGAQEIARLDYQFNNCVVKVKDLIKPDAYPDFFDNCIGCINATNTDALFKDANEDDYQLDTLSIAEGQALPIPGILIDLLGRSRDGVMPDIGCFEYGN